MRSNIGHRAIRKRCSALNGLLATIPAPIGFRSLTGRRTAYRGSAFPLLSLIGILLAGRDLKDLPQELLLDVGLGGAVGLRPVDRHGEGAMHGRRHRAGLVDKGERVADKEPGARSLAALSSLAAPDLTGDLVDHQGKAVGCHQAPDLVVDLID